MINFMMTEKNVTVNFDGKTFIVPVSDNKYEQIKEFLQEGDFDGIKELFNTEELVRNVYGVNVSIKDGIAEIDGEELPSLLSTRLVQFAKESLPYDYLVAFWNRLKNNPSYASVQELFDLLERNHHPILPDGRFLAWKCVSCDYMDKYSGKISNQIGDVVSIHRRLVDDERRNQCSYGLHCGSIEYVRDQYYSSGDIILEVAIDPADVVSVPTDHNCQKMRVCKYEVMNEVDQNTLRDDNYGLIHDDCE